MPRYELRYEPSYLQDLKTAGAPYDLPAIASAIRGLLDQAELITRNRRPLQEPISWCPRASWQLRVGAYRVLYRVDRDVVSLLRLRFKGSRTTEEMGP